MAGTVDDLKQALAKAQENQVKAQQASKDTADAIAKSRGA